MSMTSVTPARYARYIPQRYRLEAAKCVQCGNHEFPPRKVCRICGAREFEKVKLPDTGEVKTFTVVHTPGSPFTDEKPFAIGIVELAKGARITTQIADTPFEKIHIGMKVRIEFRRIQSVGEEGVLAYGYKVVPV